jgi:glycosyltransferase involved in cell wall biosynthesis
VSSPAPTPYLSLVLACYNEAEHLEASFAEIRDTLAQASWTSEVIFVDDCSRDRTPEILARILTSPAGLELKLIRHERNQGRGATVSEGFRAARGTITGYLDVDLEVHCRYVPALVRAIERGADIATVRRIYAFQLGSLDRYLMSRGYSWIVRRLLALPYHDTESGYKFFRRERVLALLDEIEDHGWFWDTEFMTRAARRGLQVAEVPGAYIRRSDKTSTVRGFRDSARYFAQVIRFRRRLARERADGQARRPAASL